MKTNFIKLFSVLFILQSSLGPIAFAEPGMPVKGSDSAPTPTVASKPPAEAPKPPQAAAVQPVPAAQPVAGQPAVKPGEGPGDDSGDAKEALTFTKLLAEGGVCEGKADLLNSFVNEVEIPDGKGGKTKYKGKLTEKEDEWGDRNFNFEKLESAIFNENNDEKTNDCLTAFSQSAVSEWFGYFNSMNETFHCGLAFKEKQEDNTISVKDVPGKTAECDVLIGDEKMYDYMKRNMGRFADVVSSYSKKMSDYMKKYNETAHGPDKSKTQAGPPCQPGSTCETQSKELKDSKYIKTVQERSCCTKINERWAMLGFTTVKDSKADDRICKEMIDKDTDNGYCADSYCVNDLGNCVKNFASAFLKDFFSSIVDSWKLWSYGEQLVTLAREIWANPKETAKNIAKNLFGADTEYMSCLNKKSQAQYICQMFGKFAGNTAGFSAGFGAVFGLARGLGKGVAARAGLFTKTIAKDPKASLILKPLKEARDAGLKGFGLGALTPLHIPGLAIKGTVGILKGSTRFLAAIPKMIRKGRSGFASSIPAAAGAMVQGAGNVAARLGGEAGKLGEAAMASGKALRNSSKGAAAATGEAGAARSLEEVNKAISKIEFQSAQLGDAIKSARAQKIPRTKKAEAGGTLTAEKTAEQAQLQAEPLNRSKQYKGARNDLRAMEYELAALKAERASLEAQKAANLNKWKDRGRAGTVVGASAQKQPKKPDELVEEKKEAPGTAAPVPGVGAGTSQNAAAPGDKKDATKPAVKAKAEPATPKQDKSDKPDKSSQPKSGSKTTDEDRGPGEGSPDLDATPGG